MSGQLLSKAGRFLLDTSREAFQNIIDEEKFYERVIGIEKAVLAMKEAKVKKETIIAMLQKHWDLRLSEAENFVYTDEDVKKLKGKSNET